MAGPVQQRTVWAMIIGFMGVIYMIWLYLTWLPAYLERERGLSLTSQPGSSPSPISVAHSACFRAVSSRTDYWRAA